MVFVTHQFPTLEQAEAFSADPELHAAMARAGVGHRREFFEDITGGRG